MAAEGDLFLSETPPPRVATSDPIEEGVASTGDGEAEGDVHLAALEATAAAAAAGVGALWLAESGV